MTHDRDNGCFTNAMKVLEQAQVEARKEAMALATMREREHCLAVVKAKRFTMKRATTPNDGRPQSQDAKVADRMFEDAEDAIRAGVAYAVSKASA